MIPLKEGVIISIRKVVKHEEGAIFILSLFVEFDHARSMIYHSAAYIRNDRIPTSLDVCCPRLNPTSGMCILDVYGSCQISGNRMVEWGVGGGGGYYWCGGTATANTTTTITTAITSA